MAFGPWGKLVLPLAAAAVLLMGGVSVHAQAPDAVADPNVPPALSGEELAQAEARRRELFRMLLADPTNLDVAFEYAGLSARVGDIEAAISTLQLMLVYAPGLSRLQLELGVLYFRLGADEDARYYFESALAGPDVPDVVRARVDPYLEAIQKRTAGYTFGGTIAGGLRYQTNANAGPSGTVRIQGIPFEVDATSAGQPDYDRFVAGNARYSYDLQNQGDRLNVDLAFYGAWYENLHDINTALAEVKLGPVFDLERFGMEDTTFAVYALGGGVLLAEEPYLGILGGGSTAAKLLTPRTLFSVRTEYRREKYIDSTLRPTASDRTGQRVTGSARVQQQLNDRFSIFASFDGERRDTRKDYLNAWQWGGTAGWILAIQSPNTAQTEPWTVAMTGGYLQREFDAPDPTIDPTQRQFDEELFVIGSFTLPMRDGWALQAQGGYREVDSNYDVQVFDNTHGSLSLLKRF